jgi:hypothetical protein
MKHIIAAFALATSGAFVASAGAYAAQADEPSGLYREAAIAGPAIGALTWDDQREVIDPPSSIDPGMAVDPPQTGAKTPIFRPPTGPSNRLVLPR